MTKNKITFYGTDASNDISLLEYGLLVSKEKHEDNSGTQFCVYMIDEDSFGTAHISEEDIDELLKGEDWASMEDLNGFYSYVGTAQDEYMEINLANKLYDLKSYFGYENIFGTDYSPITKEEAEKLYL